MVAALPTSLYRPLKKNKARNDKVTLKATSEGRSTACQIVFANPGAGTWFKRQTARLRRAPGKSYGARHVSHRRNQMMQNQERSRMTSSTTRWRGSASYLDFKAEAINGHQSQVADLEEIMRKAQADIQKDHELTSLENTIDQARRSSSKFTHKPKFTCWHEQCWLAMASYWERKYFFQKAVLWRQSKGS